MLKPKESQSNNKIFCKRRKATVEREYCEKHQYDFTECTRCQMHEYPIRDSLEKEPEFLPILSIGEKEGYEVLREWKKEGIDIDYITVCLDFAKKQQSVLNLQVDNRIKKFENSLKFVEETKEKIKKIIKLIEELPFFEVNRLRLFISQTDKEPMLKRQIEEKETELKKWKKRLHTFEQSERIHKDNIRFCKQKYPPFKLPGKMFTNINIPLALVYNHLSEKIGTPAYGKRKTVSLEYQEDILTLFHEITPGEFPHSLSLNTLSQRISNINKNHPDILKDCENYMLAFMKNLPL